ncbi:MAG TPA: class I SAM-dependent methyltransferase [Anaerolineaceae bacterium]
MADKELEEVYREKSEKYERMVAREDYQNNIYRAIMQIRDLHGLDVIDTGAGTGRLACMFAPIARTMRAYDLSEGMITVAQEKLAASGLKNWETGVADHRALPAETDSADVILSGWSVVYTVVWSPENWREELEKALKELQRVLRPGGTLIILETNGTGYETPTPPADLLEYFRYLDGAGFQYTWIRTDYQFESMEEGKDLTTFFFGDAIVEKFSSTDPAILPECTGIWWKQF